MHRKVLSLSPLKERLFLTHFWKLSFLFIKSPINYCILTEILLQLVYFIQFHSSFSFHVSFLLFVSDTKDMNRVTNMWFESKSNEKKTVCVWKTIDSPSEVSFVDGELDVRGMEEDCSLVLEEESLPCEESMVSNDFSIEEEDVGFDDGWWEWSTSDVTSRAGEDRELSERQPPLTTLSSPLSPSPFEEDSVFDPFCMFHRTIHAYKTITQSQIDFTTLFFLKYYFKVEGCKWKKEKRKLKKKFDENLPEAGETLLRRK